ncbi:MAG: UDP-glucose/GDP-mannose dehydrogenase family protein [Deltaproteobacteria bacterium]|nr:UDP-glucose/GDP-mannose dehydrogenase family protein [Deltaproteobacteria bacterium]
MQIAIIGTGYVGLVTGAGLAETGNHVTCIDRDDAKIRMLLEGKIPFFEPGLDDLVLRNVKAGRLSFARSVAEGVKDAAVVFLAVGTPSQSDGSADLSQVLDAVAEVGKAIKDYTVVVTKSTVPVGTADKVRARLAESTKVPFAVASNPEFLKEGDAVNDFLKPDRIVVGTDDERARKVLEDLYSPFIIREHRVLFMDVRSAEMTKYAANAMLATKISFINEIANLCEKVGADVELVRKGIGADARIGTAFIYPGLGYGGSCFPKDVKALVSTGREYGQVLSILEAVESVNQKQRGRFLERILNHFGGKTAGKTVAVWGLSFKPRTDDLREAPALTLIDGFLSAGLKVRAYDPVGMDGARPRFQGKDVVLTADALEATRGAHALVLCTEWSEFRQPDWDVVKQNLAAPVVFDGRNVYDPVRMRALGFTYTGVGRR